MRVTVDQDKCVGSGQCVLALPDVFDQRDEDSIVKLLRERPSADDGSELHRAARNCPSQAITIDED